MSRAAVCAVAAGAAFAGPTLMPGQGAAAARATGPAPRWAGAAARASSPATVAGVAQSGAVAVLRAAREAAGARSGAPLYNSDIAGYLADGRDFRYLRATVRLPDGCAASQSGRLLGVGLAAPAAEEAALVGLVCLPGTSVYIVVVVVAVAGHFILNAPGYTLPEGDAATVGMYLDSPGASLHLRVHDPAAGVSGDSVYVVPGALFTAAAAAAFPLSAAVTAKDRLAQFFSGRITTVSGERGTFTGPWSTCRLVATSNGEAPPFGTSLAAPSTLWSNDGRPGDAFGIWQYPY